MVDPQSGVLLPEEVGGHVLADIGQAHPGHTPDLVPRIPHLLISGGPLKGHIDRIGTASLGRVGIQLVVVGCLDHAIVIDPSHQFGARLIDRLQVDPVHRKALLQVGKPEVGRPVIGHLTPAIGIDLIIG